MFPDILTQPARLRLPVTRIAALPVACSKGPSDCSPEETSIREELRKIDPERAISHIQTLDDLVDDATVEPRLNTALVASFAGMDLLLAAVPRVYFAAAALLAVTVVAASCLPARRAASIDPTEALKTD